MFKYNNTIFKVDYGMKEFAKKKGKKKYTVNLRSAIVQALDATDDKKEVGLEFLPVLAVGEAFCSLKDNFNKSKGRKLALARCVQKLGWNDKTRTEFWKAYIEKYGKED